LADNDWKGENGYRSRKNRPKDTDSMLVTRIPPQNIEAEKSVLGSMLLDKDAILTAEDMLNTDDFYREAHAIIFKAILNLSHRGEPADILTVTEELRKLGRLDDVGGLIYVNELPASVGTTKSVGRHAQIVADKAKLRRLINAAATIADEAYNQQAEVADITDEAERSILEVTRDERRSDFTPIGEAVQNELQEITRKFKNKENITGLATGFPSLDALTNGFQKGDFIIVAARPSMGKTAFVLNMAKNMSISSAHKSVAFFSLEMSREQLVQRLLCSTALVDSSKIRTGRISTQKEWDRLANAASVLMDAPLWIDDTPGISVGDIRSKCRRLKAEHGLDVVMIDYLQLMQSKNASRNGDNRQQEISDISRSLKSLARELNVPVIALSQLSRSVEARQDHRPFLSDLRESGSLEQDADMVSFLYREAYYNREIEDDDPRKNETEVILAKNRNGPVDTVKLHFAGQFTLFYELTNREPPPDMQG
jgi:replicative DNA helicase